MSCLSALCLRPQRPLLYMAIYGLTFFFQVCGEAVTTDSHQKHAFVSIKRAVIYVV